MDMEVVVSVPATEFNLDSASSSPYITAPSSPNRFCNILSSPPTSPSPTNYSSFQDFDTNSRSSNDKGNCKSDVSEDFEFNLNGLTEEDSSLSVADDLFQGGKIRPLQPSVGYDQTATDSSPSLQNSRVLEKNDFDPFEKAIEESRKREEHEQCNWGRQGQPGSCLSPFRVSSMMVEQQESLQSEKIAPPSASKPKSLAYPSIFSAFWFTGRAYKKWNLKDLLLFRSDSEGRAATSKDPLKKHDLLPKKEREEATDAGYLLTEGIASSVCGSSKPGAVPISAHELHYSENRAVSEELKRKTFLPYKQGLLGCLGFNPGVHDISRSGTLTRGRS